MAMTEEERRAARNAASKRWYEAHKAAKAAQNKAGKPKAKKVELKPAKQDCSKLEKQVDRFVEKAEKTADAYKALVKDAAQILADVYKAGDEKLVAKACKAFGKKLSLEVVDVVQEEGVARLKPSVGAKVFRIPKVKPAASQQTAETEPEEDDVAPKEKVVSVDPTMLTGIEDGSVSAADVDAESDTDEDFDDEDSGEEKDPDDMDDEEYAEYLERQAEKEAEDWADGKADMMRELESQGAYED